MNQCLWMEGLSSSLLSCIRKQGSPEALIIWQLAQLRLHTFVWHYQRFCVCISEALWLPLFFNTGCILSCISAAQLKAQWNWSVLAPRWPIICQSSILGTQICLLLPGHIIYIFVKVSSQMFLYILHAINVLRSYWTKSFHGFWMIWLYSKMSVMRLSWGRVAFQSRPRQGRLWESNWFLAFRLAPLSSRLLLSEFCTGYDFHRSTCLDCILCIWM